MQTDNTILDKSGPGSNGNERVSPHFQELQNRSLTTKCILVSYPGHFEV